MEMPRGRARIQQPGMPAIIPPHRLSFTGVDDVRQFIALECMIARNLSVEKLPGLASAALALCMGLSLAGCSKNAATDIRPEATLEELNVALDTWMMVKATTPQSVNELTNFPALKTKRLPTASPGKKLAIDPATRRVVFANE